MPVGEQEIRPTAPTTPDLHALTPHWRHVKDAFYSIIVDHTTGRDRSAAWGTPAERRLLAHLAHVHEVPAHAEPVLVAAVADLAHDLGRHVHSKAILDDSMDQASLVLGGALDAMDAGTLVTTERAPRRVTLAFHAGPALAACAPRVRVAFLEGVLRGAFSEGFNCEARVMHSPPGTFHVILGAGRDVNLEVQR